MAATPPTGTGPLGIPGPPLKAASTTQSEQVLTGTSATPPPALGAFPSIAGAPAKLPGSSAGLGPGASIIELESYVRKTYGYMAGFLDIPEVRTVLLNAARNGWGSEELYGALSQTQWWQTTSASARQWQQLVSEDPASAKAQAAQAAASIGDLAKQYGLNLTGAQIGDLAVQSSQFGWSNQQTLDAILKNVQWGQVQPGSITADADKVKAMAGRYLVKLSDDTAQDWAIRIAKGEMTEDGAQSILQQQAKSRWGYMAPLIDQGIAPADYFQPVRDTIASTLEMGANQIDMLDPKWTSMLEVRDEKTGEMRAATLNEAMLKARQDPRWAKTKNAQDLTAQMVGGLQTAFGRS